MSSCNPDVGVRRCARWGALGLVWLLASCGAQIPPRSIVQRDDARVRSRVGTLMLLITGDGAGGTADIVAVELAVDGRPWGTHAVQERERAAPGARDGRAGRALVVATLGAAGSQEEEPQTVGQWVALLGRSLPAGGHVAEIVSVRVRDGDREETRPVGTFLPFEVDDGDATAFAGEVAVHLSRQGGGA